MKLTVKQLKTLIREAVLAEARPGMEVMGPGATTSPLAKSAATQTRRQKMNVIHPGAPGYDAYLKAAQDVRNGWKPGDPESLKEMSNQEIVRLYEFLSSKLQSSKKP